MWSPATSGMATLILKRENGLCKGDIVMYKSTLIAELPDSFMKRTTFHQVLSEIDCTIPCENNAFFWQHLYWLNHFRFTDEMLNIFWGCMRIYQCFSVDVFEFYARLVLDFYGHCPGGEAQWKDSSKTYEIMDKEDIERRLDGILLSMHFFGISYYKGKTIEEYQCLKDNVEQFCDSFRKEKRKRVIRNQQQGIEMKVSKYFNFDYFVEQQYIAYLDYCTSNVDEESDMSINAAMLLGKNKSDAVYIVILKRAGEVIHIGKTRRLFAYLGQHEKKLGADSVIFEEVDDMYIDDVIIGAKIFYDTGVEDMRIGVCSRRYGSIKNAKFAYPRQMKIPQKRIMQTIEENRMRVIETATGQYINKIELARNLQRKAY